MGEFGVFLCTRRTLIWRSSLLFLPQWLWPQSTPMPQYMVTPPPQLMALLSLFTTLPLYITLLQNHTTNLNLIIKLNLIINLNLGTMQPLSITLLLLSTMGDQCIMLHLFTMPYTMLQFIMLQFIMHLQLIMSQNLIITNHQSAPLITPKHGVLKMLNTQLMRLSMLFNITTKVSRLFTRMCSLIPRTVLTV